MRILVDGQTLATEEAYRGIGVYFRNVFHMAVKQTCLHEWFLLVPNNKAVRLLDAWVAERVTVIVDDRANPAGGFAHNDGFTQCIDDAVERYGIDCFWMPNPLMVNVLFPLRMPKCSFYATVHDLIPLIFPPNDWSDMVSSEYKRRVDFLAADEIRLICVSKATESDVVKYLHKKDHTFVILEAADSRLFYQQRLKMDNLADEPYIVFTGGFDYRKNIDGAIEAFRLCVEQHRDDIIFQRLKLYIVCKCDAIAEEKFNKMLISKGLDERVVLTGYVSDERLVEIYSKAAVFFFPSFYEGFGLPIIEAMLAGAFVVSANNSSLPEVCGEHAMLFDAHDADDMAQCLYHGVKVSLGESIEDKKKRQMYALEFSWEKAGLLTVEAFEKSLVEVTFTEKPSLAIVTPWPYQQTGIANYIEKMLCYLANYFCIDIYMDNVLDKSAKVKPTEYANVYSLAKLEQKYGEYEHVLYQFGNNSKFHTATYELFCKYPGIAEIHDYILAPFFYHSFVLGHKKGVYQDALLTGYGQVGLDYYEKVIHGTTPQDDQLFPMCHPIVKRADKVIFHNYWSKEQLGNEGKVSVIPHPCFAIDDSVHHFREKLMAEFRSRFNLQDTDIVIGCLGFVNFNKRPESLIAAVADLVKSGYKIKLIFWGENNWNEMQEYIKRYGLMDCLHITGYLDEYEYDAGLMLSDIIVNLRYPSMGESSGTLCEAFKYARPVIVSNVNQYKEFPDEVCWKVNVNGNEVHVLANMLKYLIDNPKVRHALGENAKAYAEFVLSPEKMAKRYFEVITGK